MHVLIDAYQMTSHVTGTDRRARNVLEALQGISKDHTFTVVVNRRHSFVSEVVSAPGFSLLPLDIHHRALWLATGLPRLLVRLKADAFFSFHNLCAPVFKPCRVLVSLLDTIPFHFQDQYYTRVSERWLRRPLALGLMRLAARRGDGFLAISSFTAQSAATVLGIDPTRIETAPLQAESRFSEMLPPERLQSVRKCYGLPKKYVLTLGAAEPRKNVDGLIAAHRRLPTALREAYPLVIAGAAWRDRALTLQDDASICETGYVKEADLPALYQAATVFAWPTRFEGFGLPALEAMASGTPVIASNTTALPEVTGDAAILVDPDDTEALVAALASVLADPGRRGQLAAAGRERIKLFSWKDSAVALLKLLQPASA